MARPRRTAVPGMAYNALNRRAKWMKIFDKAVSRHITFSRPGAGLDDIPEGANG